MLKTTKNFFFVAVKPRHRVYLSRFFKSYQIDWVTFPFEKNTKTEKSLPPHVCDDRNRFTRRMTTPFASADAHGPNQVFESKFCILKSFENFFRALQLEPLHLLWCNFWWFKLDFHENSWKSLKIMKKSPPPHVWVIQNRLAWFPITPYTLLESLGLVLPYKNLFHHNSTRRTHYSHHSLKRWIFKNLWNLQFSLQNPSKWLCGSLKTQKSPPPHVCDDRNRFTRRMTTPFMMK